MTESSFKNNEASHNLKTKILEVMNDYLLSAYLLSALSKITNPENAEQFELANGCNSNRVNDLLKHNSIPVFLIDNLLTFRDTGKLNELKGDLTF